MLPVCQENSRGVKNENPPDAPSAFTRWGPVVAWKGRWSAGMQGWWAAAGAWGGRAPGWLAWPGLRGSGGPAARHAPLPALWAGNKK